MRPEAPANIGAVSRVVRNTGLRGLVLVAPGDWRTVECWRTAWGAQDVLEQARVHEDLAAALAPYAMAVAFSGRKSRDAPAADVREAAAAVAALPPEQDAALVFGPEATGLTLAELSVCGRRAVIPSHPAQPSLNLSHAVMVAAYEVFRARAPEGARTPPRVASHAEREEMLALLREGLLAVGGVPPVDTDRFFEDWRRLFQKTDLTPREVRLLEHMARKMIQRGRAAGSAH